ncbi:MAG: DUF3267 domain-containing protein [Clostridia bacterium]|nr:DUF3267 domain-containing protein [Clostridia bacterium]
MTKHWERALPPGYRQTYVIDAKSTKISIILSLGALAITAAVFMVAVLMIKPKDFFAHYSMSKYMLTAAAIIAYIILHELTHGAAYKLLTKQKLKFGFTLTVAYCGVPDIYVYRTASLIALLAPFVVFDIVFGVAVALLQDPWDKTYAAALLALHLGGCIGDLYDTCLYLFKFRDPRTLMRDTGPMQTFYVPEI